MISISNTTPIISLIKVNKLELLKELFGEVYISKGVFDEIIANYSFNQEAQILKECEFIKVINVKNEFAVKLLQKNLGLDLGESESIVLFDELNGDILFIDERKGRLVAKSMSINIAGTLGILLKAKEKGLLSEFKSTLNKLIEANIRISPRLYEEILNKAGETPTSHL